MYRILFNNRIHLSVIIITIMFILPFVIGMSATSFAANSDSTIPNSGYADYTTLSFDVDVNADENHVMHVTETITCDFTGSFHHGIFRYIPLESKYYNIKNIDAPDWYYDLDESSGTNGNGQPYKYKIIKIGDADRYLTGVNTFVIKYDMVCYEDDISDADYLAMDLLPTAWETPIGSCRLSLTMPKAINRDDVNLYSGTYGNKGGLSDAFTYEIANETNTIIITGKNISDYTGLTVNVTLDEGYWENPASRKIYRIFMYIFLIGIPLLTGIIWFMFGRDPKIIKTVEFYPPQDMTPAELGYAVDGVVDSSDITAMIMYYAEKGWLSIEEPEKGKFELTMQQSLSALEGEKNFSKNFFKALFRNGERLSMDNLPENFGEDIDHARKEISNDFVKTNRELYTAKSETARFLGRILMLIPAQAAVCISCIEMGASDMRFYMSLTLIVQLIGLYSMLKTFDRKDGRSLAKNLPRLILSVVATSIGAAVPAVIVGILTGRWLVAVMVTLSILVTFFFVVFMKSRSKESAIRQGKILGFKDFILTAEYDRLKMLSDENPQYFFNILPYAYVLGLSTKWSRKFQNIYIPSPPWYTGYNNKFEYRYFPLAMNHWNANISDSLHAAIASKIDFSDGGGGGSFSGGGFSGGGFGGGGGGAW